MARVEQAQELELEWQARRIAQELELEWQARRIADVQQQLAPRRLPLAPARMPPPPGAAWTAWST